MGKRTSIRLYKSGDAKGINEMFTKHTPYLRDDAYWTWINRIVGQSISVVAECDDRIIGHYAVVPRNLIVKNRVLKAALGIHAFVDPDFRREISIFEISNYLYRIAQDKGIQVIYGFPNVNYRQIQDGKRLLYLNPMNCLRIRGLTILRLPYSLMRLRILIMNICFD